MYWILRDATDIPFDHFPYVNLFFDNLCFDNFPYVNLCFDNLFFDNFPFVNFPFDNFPFVNFPTHVCCKVDVSNS